MDPSQEKTSITLLGNLRSAPTEELWLRFDNLYREFLHQWAVRQLRIADNDADDLTQDIMLIVRRELPKFDYDPSRGTDPFRSWLRRIAFNQARTFRKKKRLPTIDHDGEDDVWGQLADPDGNLSAQWDREHRLHVLRKGMKSVSAQFQPKTFAAFELVALQGLSAKEVAAQLDMSIGAVHVAKSRVLAQLREELAELLE